MKSSTKKAGLRKTKAMSKRVSAQSWARVVAASRRGRGKGPLRAGAAAAASGCRAAVLLATCSKRNSFQARRYSEAATAVHNRRLASSRPLRGGSRVLRSLAVQYLVAMVRADMPKGSVRARSVSCCMSRRATRDTENSTSRATAPT